MWHTWLNFLSPTPSAESMLSKASLFELVFGHWKLFPELEHDCWNRKRSIGAISIVIIARPISKLPKGVSTKYKKGTSYSLVGLEKFTSNCEQNFQIVDSPLGRGMQ